MLDLEHTIPSDRVMERHDRRQQPLDLQHAVAETLVVVDEIELAGPVLQLTRRAG